MANYIDKRVSKLKLKNSSWTVCSLECYYKESPTGKAIRVGKTGNIAKGQSKSLALNELDIKDGVWVTAYSNVKAGKDSHGEDWVVYDKNSNSKAVYQLSGTTLSNSTKYEGVQEEDIYEEKEINQIKLSNQSGTVCALECYYKVNKGDGPKRAGSTGNMTVGFSKTLGLEKLELPENVWVTAYANVVAGADDHAKVWFRYKKGSNKVACYTISGTVGFTSIAFNGLE
jgi:hypothetical protein